MRHLKWEACYNVRDVGGYPTLDGARLREGALIRSDNLVHLTPAGQAALVAYGVRTIIDLRVPEELQMHPDPFAHAAGASAGVSYLNIPLSPEQEKSSAEHFRAARTIRESYCVALDYLAPIFARVITAMADAPEGGVLFHCHAGRDRTGMVAALALSLVRVPQETIVEDYAITDEYIKPMNDAFIAGMKHQKERDEFMHELSVSRETMRGFLAHLEQRHGGAEAYLLRAGVPLEKLERLRTRWIA
ncbi:MAG: tyrosine-protein phosphatase [Anaerolineae bacterium]